MQNESRKSLYYKKVIRVWMWLPQNTRFWRENSNFYNWNFSTRNPKKVKTLKIYRREANTQVQLMVESVVNNIWRTSQHSLEN